jgi:5-methylthioadenosine/S-adenosylhomocysteine deaminase
LEAEGLLVLPGFINAHGHAAMSLFRGVADDLELHTWLTQHIFPLEQKLTPENIYWGTLLAAAEMIKAGITCFGDMYYYPEQSVRAARQAGLRAALGPTMLDVFMDTAAQRADMLQKAKEFILAHQGGADIRPTINLHSVYTCSPSLLRQGGELAQALNVRLHMHLCETKTEIAGCLASYGCPPVAHLRNLGLLNSHLLAAHGIWLEVEEIDLLSKMEANIVHCPNSNMKLASGRAPVPEMLAAGIAVGLGSDSCASNNRLDLFTEMDVCAKWHKAAALDPAIMPARQVWQMATLLGGRALGWPELGCLQAGSPADFIVLDSDQPHLTPLHNPVSHLVYAARAADVRHTVCQGRVLMKNRQLQTLDESQIKAKAKEQIKLLLNA